MILFTNEFFEANSCSINASLESSTKCARKKVN